ncbi:hypothetical protein POTOM_031591 [Populus tomentosa]|uniref:Uncharacterized protein n=1 Tax=Populus tomentosa TaxID=118781 RepID=A0A8X7ZCX4_POPTO|nr:hypothetical protein POTOM_031591 [Populus tomentosa]
MRKQKHLDELWTQVVRLRTENHNLIDRLNHVSESHDRVLQENARLKKEASDLRQMLTDLQIGSPYTATALRDLEEVYLKMMKKQEIPASGGPCQNSFRSRRAKGRQEELVKINGGDGKGTSQFRDITEDYVFLVLSSFFSDDAVKGLPKCVGPVRGVKESATVTSSKGHNSNFQATSSRMDYRFSSHDQCLFCSLYEKNDLTTLWHRVKGRRGNWQERNGQTNTTEDRVEDGAADGFECAVHNGFGGGMDFLGDWCFYFLMKRCGYNVDDLFLAEAAAL